MMLSPEPRALRTCTTPSYRLPCSSRRPGERDSNEQGMVYTRFPMRTCAEDTSTIDSAPTLETVTKSALVPSETAQTPPPDSLMRAVVTLVCSPTRITGSPAASGAQNQSTRTATRWLMLPSSPGEALIPGYPSHPFRPESDRHEIGPAYP